MLRVFTNVVKFVKGAVKLDFLVMIKNLKKLLLKVKHMSDGVLRAITNVAKIIKYMVKFCI